MAKLLQVTACNGYKLHLTFDDGAVGDVDVSSLVGRGGFKLLTDTAVFESVSIGEHGEVRWNDSLELCPDSLYLQLTGKTPEDLFPTLGGHTDARTLDRIDPLA